MLNKHLILLDHTILNSQTISVQIHISLRHFLPGNEDDDDAAVPVTGLELVINVVNTLRVVR